MKKVFMLLFLIVVSACSSDDGGTAINEENLVGKWYFVGEKINGEPLFEYENVCATSRDYIELNADGTGIVFEYKADCTANNMNEPAEWYINGVAFTFTDYDPAASFEGFYKIVKLTQNELVLQERIEYSDGEVELLSTYFTKN